ncbi:hypothetical protein CLV01_3717 [Delftia sp. 60]|nr:hypothetical protein CLU98_2732 [Burkholderiales bacterium 23]PIF67308.1 hypothetical protein CLV01_3717 [Delftia sp. 60]
MFSSKPDGIDDSAEFSRIFFYDAQSSGDPWRHLDLPNFTTVSICSSIKAMGDRRKYVILSKNGEISVYWPGGASTENIAEAGLDKELPIYGYLNSLKEINGVLYACGGGGQIYKRGKNGWRDIAGKLRKQSPIPKANLALNTLEIGDDISDIDGYSEDNLYAAGRDGIYHFDGKLWSEVDISTDEIIMSIFCAPDGVIWACGFNGAILRGDFKNGFKDISHYDDNMILTKMVFFRTKYISLPMKDFFPWTIKKKSPNCIKSKK